MSGYPYQAISHEASISAERDPRNRDKVIVEIWRGDKVTRIKVWAEDFQSMARDVLGTTS